MVSICELAKVLAYNEAVIHEVGWLQKNIEPKLQSVNVVTELELRIDQYRDYDYDDDWVEDYDVEIIKSNIDLFKDKYLVGDIEFEKPFSSTFFEGKCSVYIKDKCIIEVKSGEHQDFYLVQLALYNILNGKDLHCYLFNPVKGYVYGGDISSLCKEIKVAINNYVLLKFNKGNIYLLKDLLTYSTDFDKFDNNNIEYLTDVLLHLFLYNEKIIAMDCKSYNPHKGENYILEEFINISHKYFVFFNKKEKK